MSALAGESKVTVLNQFVFSSQPCAADRLCDAARSNWQAVRLSGNGRGQERPQFFSQASFVSGIDVHPLLLNGRQVGSCYEDNDARYCRLCRILPEDATAPRLRQSQSVFETLAKALEQGGFQFADTIRTWFYLDRLLDWYADFNDVRTAFFNQTGIFTHTVPASTGIGMANDAGTAIVADLLAMKPKHDRVTIGAVPSPLQGSPLGYQSSFSRAVEVVCPAYRILHISGTASIDPQGRSAHPGDPSRQIELTLDVVEALLKSCGMNWDDAFRGIVYYTDMQYDRLFCNSCGARRIPSFPLARACADICRNDLLFEIEIDAIKMKLTGL